MCCKVDFAAHLLISISIKTLVPVLSGSFGLLAAFDTGAFIMLSLANLCQDACLCAAAFKTLQRTVDGFSIL